MLDAFISNIDSLSLGNVPFNGKDFFKVSKFFSDYFSGNEFLNDDSIAKLLTFQACSSGAILPANSPRSLNSYPDRHNMYSSEFNAFIDSITEEVDGLSSDNIDTYIDNIKNIESQIGDTYSLNDLEKRYALMGGSLSRFSGAYWVDQYQKFNTSGENSDWAEKNGDLGGEGWAAEVNQPSGWVYGDIGSFFGGSYVYATIGVLVGSTGGGLWLW